MAREDFIAALMPAAIEASQRIGVDPRLIVAQAAQETGWGKSAPGNNYFGIKSHGQGGGQNLTTHEVINGKRVKINDSFRKFASPGDSVAGYADFLSRNKRYRPMLEANGLDAQLQALGRSGYATDPNYAQSVGAIAKSIPLNGQYAAQPQQPAMADGPKGQEAYPQAAPPLSAPRTIADAPIGTPQPTQAPQPQQSAPQGLLAILTGGGETQGAANPLLSMLAAAQPQQAPQMLQPPQAPQQPSLADYITQFMQARTA